MTPAPGPADEEDEMDVAMVGLGRMGGNMARRLLRGGHRVVVWNRTYAKAEELGRSGSCCPTATRRRRRSTS
jgi:3-hydroxyisobutyrate dehydrogenase-like beta-hydroxyacid dehydrogenase